MHFVLPIYPSPLSSYPMLDFIASLLIYDINFFICLAIKQKRYGVCVCGALASVEWCEE